MTKKTGAKKSTKKKLTKKQVSAKKKALRLYTLKKRTAFLAAFSQTGNLTASAREADIDRGTHYLWLKDPAYVLKFDDAQNKAVDLLEAYARMRASTGITEDVWHKGKIVGKKKVVSNLLLIFLLKALRPEKYRERYEFTGKDGSPLAVSIYIPDNGRD